MHGELKRIKGKTYQQIIVWNNKEYASESRIRDVDMAKALMDLTKQKIIKETGIAMFAQSNKQHAQVLELLK